MHACHRRLLHIIQTVGDTQSRILPNVSCLSIVPFGRRTNRDNVPILRNRTAVLCSHVLHIICMHKLPLFPIQLHSMPVRREQRQVLVYWIFHSGALNHWPLAQRTGLCPVRRGGGTLMLDTKFDLAGQSARQIGEVKVGTAGGGR